MTNQCGLQVKTYRHAESVLDSLAVWSVCKVAEKLVVSMRTPSGTYKLWSC